VSGIDERVAKYVELGLSQGYSEDKIRAKLRDAGYSDSLIDEAFAHHNQFKDEPEQPFNEFKNFLKVYHKKIIIITIALVVGVWAIATIAANISHARIIADDFGVLFGNKIPEQKCLESANPDICLIKEAKARDTTFFCRKIGDRTVKRACEERFWERRDCFYERLVGEGLDECYIAFARETGDSRVCNFISRPLMKATCLDGV